LIFERSTKAAGYGWRNRLGGVGIGRLAGGHDYGANERNAARVGSAITGDDHEDDEKQKLCSLPCGRRGRMRATVKNCGIHGTARFAYGAGAAPNKPCGYANVMCITLLRIGSLVLRNSANCGLLDRQLRTSDSGRQRPSVRIYGYRLTP
jgi:hypothetical protein